MIEREREGKSIMRKQTKKRLKSERKVRQKDRRNGDRVTRLKHWTKAS